MSNKRCWTPMPITQHLLNIITPQAAEERCRKCCICGRVHAVSSSSSFKLCLSDWSWVWLFCGIDRSGPVTCLCVKKPVGDRKPSIRVDRKQTSDHTYSLGTGQHTVTNHNSEQHLVLTQPCNHFCF